MRAPPNPGRTVWTTIGVLALGAVCVTASARQNAAAGKATYTKQCVACHGADGKPKVPKCPNLADKNFQKAHPDAEFVQATTNGKGTMPAFKGKLTPAQVKDVIAYVRTLGK